MTVDFITLCRAPNRRLTKRIEEDGAISGYDLVKRVDLSEIVLADLPHFAAVLHWLAPQQDTAIVRGRVRDTGRVRGVRRLLHHDFETNDPPTLIEAPHSWLGL